LLLSPVLGAPLLFAGLKLSSDAEVVQHNLRDKEFYGKTLDAGQSVHGYVYYSWPSTPPGAASQVVVVEAVDSASGETTRFRVPINTNFSQ
jgi:hypothetical protein